MIDFRIGQEENKKQTSDKKQSEGQRKQKLNKKTYKLKSEVQSSGRSELKADIKDVDLWYPLKLCVKQRV
ncbi:hypothetical protein DWY84_00930 [Clostridium sp. AF27-2AA]|nr:hypothetical protein DWY84_00930 [Clostridium sp. AF27-2AA]